MTLFPIKSNLVATPVSEHVSLSDEVLLLETLEFLSTSHDSNQLLNSLRYLSLSMQYPIFYVIDKIYTSCLRKLSTKGFVLPLEQCS